MQLGHFRIILSLFLEVSLVAHLSLDMKMRFHSHGPQFDGEA